MTKVALATAALLPFFAQAQTQVNLYGLVDMGVNHVSNVQGQSLTELRSGNSMTSRWGIRGTEDLGGGNKVQFTMESGIQADTGEPSSRDTYFNRQSWLGLSNEAWGEVRMGRQLSVLSDGFSSSTQSTYMGTQAAAVDGSSVTGASANRFNNMIGGTRVNNSLKYTSPNIHGLKLRAMMAFGEKADSSKQARLETVGATYKRGAWEGNVAYQVWHADGVSAVNTSKDKVAAVGVRYLPQNGLQVSAYFSQQKNAKNIQGMNANVISLMALYPVQQFTLMGGYQKLNDLSVANRDIDQFNLGVEYALSKRTDLYALASLQKVSNGGTAGMFSKLSSDDRQRQFNVGVRHSF